MEKKQFTDRLFFETTHAPFSCSWSFFSTRVWLIQRLLLVDMSQIPNHMGPVLLYPVDQHIYDVKTILFCWIFCKPISGAPWSH